MKNLKTPEIQILLNMENEIQKYREKSDDSLILQWFNSKGVLSPLESYDAFKYNVHFIGSEDKAKYNGFGIIIYPEKKKYSKCFIGQMKRGRRSGKGWRLMNDTIFEGSYRRDLKHGPAKHWKFNDSGFEKVFDGSYSEGKMHGFCYFKDHEHTFKGHIYKGKYHGNYN